MACRYEMRFTGSGGQGVILASVIMAEAAVMAGKVTVQSQSYGPEARGGSSKAETVISDSEIYFTKVTHPNFLLALTQSALDKYGFDTAAGAVILIDDELNPEKCPDTAKVVSLPIISTAKTKVGKAMTANVVAVGAINALLGLFDEEVLQKAVWRHIPKGTEELNGKALTAGKELISEELAAKYKVEL